MIAFTSTQRPPSAGVRQFLAEFSDYFRAVDGPTLDAVRDRTVSAFRLSLHREDAETAERQLTPDAIRDHEGAEWAPFFGVPDDC